MADYWTPETVASQRKFGTGLMQAGTDASPVGHWTQALARVLQGGVGGYTVGQANEGERQGKQAVADTWQQGLQRGQPIKAIAASLMGNPWGQEQGQSLASQALQTEASQGFQRSQQDRQFAQQMKMQQGSQAHAERMALLTNRLQIEGAGKQASERFALGQRYGLQGDDLNTFAMTGQYSPKPQTFELGEGQTRFQQIRNPDGTIKTVPIASVAKGPDSTARKAIYEAQDELPNIRGSIDLLNEAKTLLGTAQQPGIYTGYGAQLRSDFNQSAPSILPNLISDPQIAQNTQRYNQIMTAEAISAMSQSLKGATTNEEMARFIKIINDPHTQLAVKIRAIDQMLTAAQRHYKNKEDRIRELGGRMPDLSGQPPAGGVTVRVNSPEEAMRLPSGTQFMAPDGTIRVRP